MRSQNKKGGRVTRREFVWEAGVLGAGIAAGSAALPVATSVSPAQQAEATEARPVHSESWNVQLAPDGQHITLSHRGRQWLSQLSVSLKANGQIYHSDMPGAKLRLGPPAKPGETVVKASGHANFDIVFMTGNSRLEVELRNVGVPSFEAAEVQATVHAGSDPLQARLTDTGDDIQQMVSGVAASGLNDCVYDRFRDQALRVNARTRQFVPTSSGFRLTASTRGADAPICGMEVIERVYERRLPYYAPLDKKLWPDVPIGWCSFHYFGNVLEEDDILRNAQALAQHYEAFGLRYILIDGGWQAHGISGNWTEVNSKFSHGMKWLTDKIRALGLKSAIWLSEFATADEDFYNAHKGWFLHDAQGNAKLGTWFGTYVADFSNPAVKQYLYNVYRQITVDWGYDYFKLDGENATRDIWGQNRVRAYNPALDADTAFRQALGLLREAMNSRPGVFFSACGPVYATESMGIVQSARLGGDILAFSSADPSPSHSETPSFRCVRTALEGMRRGYYTHNIAWYADPDGVLARPPLTIEEIQTWFSVLGLTGQLLMLGDDIPALSEERLDIPRKIMPVADVKPMDLYPQSVTPRIWVLHIGRAFGAWAVVGLFNWDYDAREVPFTDAGETSFFSVLHRDDQLLSTSRERIEAWALAEDSARALAENQRLQALPEKPPGLQLLPVPAYLTPPPPRQIALNFAQTGLSEEPEYLLFDFWKQAFLGKIRGEYEVKLLPHACQVLSLRPASGHPQVIGTDRHITMGGVELKDERWDAEKKQLIIVVQLVERYPSKFTIYKAASRFVRATAMDAAIEALETDEIVTVRLENPASSTAKATLQFA